MFEKHASCLVDSRPLEASAPVWRPTSMAGIGYGRRPTITAASASMFAHRRTTKVTRRESFENLNDSIVGEGKGVIDDNGIRACKLRVGCDFGSLNVLMLGTNLAKPLTSAYFLLLKLTVTC